MTGGGGAAHISDLLILAIINHYRLTSDWALWLWGDIRYLPHIMRRLTNLFASRYESNSTNNRLIIACTDMQCREINNLGAQFLSLAVIHFIVQLSYNTVLPLLWCVTFMYSHRQSLRAEIYCRRWFDTPMRNADMKTHCLHRTACTHILSPIYAW